MIAATKAANQINDAKSNASSSIKDSEQLQGDALKVNPSSDLMDKNLITEAP